MESRKTVTVLFSDVSGFTSLGERLDPEVLHQVMAQYFADMRSVLEAHGGTIEKFVGDAIMAVFGIPTVHEDDALRAVRAATQMRSSLLRLNDHLTKRWGVALEFHVGVNTGEVVAGSHARGETFALGNAVNIAARLQQVASPGEILIGADTYYLVRGAVAAESLSPLELKNHQELVAAYRLLGVTTEVPTRQLDSPIVGRQNELEQLSRAYELAVSEPPCRLVTIVGPAGIGKSRLAAELVRNIEDEATVLSGRCLPYGEGITFWPIVEVVRKAAGITEEDSPMAARAKVQSLVAEGDDSALVLERLLGAIGITHETHGAEEIFWGVRKLLEAMAGDRPVVVTLDDVQWAEPTFLDLVEYLLSSSTDARILLVCMARPELLEIRPAWESALSNCEHVRLERLGPDHCRQLIENLLGENPFPAQTHRRITQTADGNPLFLEEIMRMLIDDGILHNLDGTWSVQGDVSSISPPPTIQALLASRLDGLESEQRAVMQRASVIGQVFWWGALDELCDDDMRPRVASHLDALVRKEFIRPCESSFSGDEAFSFAHMLVRDAAYQSTPKQLRCVMHERFATWLDTKTGDRADEHQEIIGYHLEQAYQLRNELGPPDEHALALGSSAAARLVPAGKRAYEREDMPGALNLFERAIALLPPQHPERLRTMPQLGAVLIDSGEFSRADQLLQETMSAASSVGDRSVETYARLERLRLRILADPEGALDEAIAESQMALGAYHELGDEFGLAKTWNLLGNVHFQRGRVRAAEEAWQEALTHARRAGSVHEASESLSSVVGVLEFGPTPVEMGLRRCEETLGSSGSDQKVTASALVARGALEAMQARFGRARRDVAMACTIYEELGLKVMAANCAQTAGFVEMLAGHPKAAEGELRRGYGLLEAMEERGYLSTVAAQLAHALLAQDRLEDAERAAGISEALAAHDDVTSQVLWRTARAKALAARGRFPEGVELARSAVELVDGTEFVNLHADALLDLAKLLSHWQPEAAFPAIQSAQLRYRDKGNLVGSRRAMRLLDSLLREAHLEPRPR